MHDRETIIRNLQDSSQILDRILNNDRVIRDILAIAESVTACFRQGGKLLLCGNGGSAADAEHLAAEFSGRYYLDRPPLPAEALHTNSAFLTAVANDYTFDVIFSRLLSAVGKKGDVLMAFSTSGNSKNVIHALETAQSMGITTVGFSGHLGGKMKAHADILIEIPSTNTPRIQECHMLIGHSICEIVERTLFPQPGQGT